MSMALKVLKDSRNWWKHYIQQLLLRTVMLIIQRNNISKINYHLQNYIKVLTAPRCLNHISFLPRFQVAEFLGDYFPQVNTQSIDNSLCKIWMRCTTKNFDIRHSTSKKRTRLFQLCPNQRLCSHWIWHDGHYYKNITYNQSQYSGKRITSYPDERILLN